MTRAEQWNRDTQIEQMAAQFLDANFYNHIKHPSTRHHDTYHQFGGVDIEIGPVKFDEKCKVKGCMNKVAPFIGFECSLINKANQLHTGWFLNSDLSTDYYAIIGLSATVSDDRQLSSSSQISAADVLWVKKQDVVDYVQSFEGHYGKITLQQISSDASELRLHSDGGHRDAFGNSTLDASGKARHKYPHRKYWLTYSTKMKEKPVNLVIPRDTLEKMPHTKHFIVTKSSVKRMGGK